MFYLRKQDADTWHWIVECSNYPDRSHWVTGTSAVIRESLGKEGEATVTGTGRGGRVTKLDLVRAAIAMDGLSLVVRQDKPTSGELCDECLAKDRT